MSIEQAQAFIEKVQNDEDLQKRLSQAQDRESKLEIARQEGFEFTEEEFIKASECLTDKELEAEAGGVTDHLYAGYSSCSKPNIYWEF